MLLFALCFNASAKDSNPKLADIKNLAGIDNVSFDSPVIKNLQKFNSKSALTSLSLKKYNADKNAYTPKKFNFSINPYAWFAAVGGIVGYTPDGYKYGFNKSFSDAVKYLKMAAAVAGKFKYERVSFVYDISYVNLKGFGTEFPNGKGIASANWTVKQTIYDLFLAYLFPSKSKATMIDVYLGTRVWALNNGSTITDTLGKQEMHEFDNTWVNPVIGVNSEFVIGNQWAAYLKGDVGVSALIIR